MFRKTRRWIPTGLTVLAVLAVISCGGRPASPPVADDAEETLEQPPLAVEVMELTRGPLVSNVEATGTVQGVNEAFVVSETQGIVKAVRFELGDRVEADQVMTVVDETVARLAMEEARRQAETAKLELETTQTLSQQGNSSRAALIRAEAAYSGANARLEAAIKAYRDTSVRAPIDGYVASKEDVAALGSLLSPGTPVATIVDLSAIRIEVGVGEAEIGLIRPGLTAEILIPAACGQTVHRGQVAAIAAGSDPRTGSYTVVVTGENPCPAQLKAGMTAFVSIITEEQTEALLVPLAAVVQSAGGNSVFTVVDDRVRQVPVTLGRNLGDRAELLDGVEEKTLLAVSGLPALKQGMQVQTTRVGQTGGRR